MPLDPQAQALLEQMKMMGFVYKPELTVAQVREQLKMLQTARPAPEAVERGSSAGRHGRTARPGVPSPRRGPVR